MTAATRSRIEALRQGCPRPTDRVTIPCLYCGKMLEYPADSLTAQGVFNSFCPDDDCEDRFAALL